MVEDGTQTVQTEEPAQNQEQVSQNQEVSANVETTNQDTLTADKVQQMIADAVKTAVQEAKDVGRRELQSQQDRNRAEIARAERRARVAESELNATSQSLNNLDPDIAKEVALARYRAREQGNVQSEQAETAMRTQQEFHQQFQDNLNQFITGLGVDPKDPRIDWAEDAPNYLEAQRRVLESVSGIQKEKIQTIQSGLETRLKALEAQANEANVENNSVETTTSQGVAAGSDAEFVKQFGSGELPMTKTNIDRYNKIRDSY